MGSIIYITDKINISANARRTFIEVADNDAIEFLKLIAQFVSDIYNARYALSKYRRGKTAIGQDNEKFNQLRETANAALQKLALDEITIDADDNAPLDFEDLSEIEKKKAIKKTY